LEQSSDDQMTVSPCNSRSSCGMLPMLRVQVRFEIFLISNVSVELWPAIGSAGDGVAVSLISSSVHVSDCGGAVMVGVTVPVAVGVAEPVVVGVADAVADAVVVGFTVEVAIDEFPTGPLRPGWGPVHE